MEASANNSFENVNDPDPRPDEEPKAEAIDHYIQQIKETADKLLRDRASRGDLKLLSTAMRELRYCFKVFNMFRERRKVTVFGSARLQLTDPSCVQAIEFGRRMAELRWMVITGAAAGIMEAGHVGAGAESSIGINILLPFEQHANPVIKDDSTKLMHLKYFFTRKLLFVKESDAIVLFPGGFGTLDEGFEALTLIQTGKSHIFPILMVDEPGGDYWKHVFEFIDKVLLRRGLISPDDLALLKVTDSVDEAVAEILNFDRFYHGMRYVRGDLVLRIKRRLSDALLRQINAEFANILHGGTIEQTEALPDEANDPHLAAYPRLRFRFDRRNL